MGKRSVDGGGKGASFAIQLLFFLERGEQNG